MFVLVVVRRHVEQPSVFVFGVGVFMVLVMHCGAHVLSGLLHRRLMFEAVAMLVMHVLH